MDGEVAIIEVKQGNEGVTVTGLGGMAPGRGGSANAGLSDVSSF